MTSLWDAAPWCGACAWNLDVYDTDHVRPVVGWRRADRRLFRMAFELNATMYQELVASPIGQPGWGLARVVTVALSLMLYAGTLSTLVCGIWLATIGFPGVALLPACACVLLAVALRPRLGHLPEHTDQLARSEAPTLFALVDQVAAAVAAPVPQVIVVDRNFNAFASTIGLRRRRVLGLGLPLLAVLPADQRVALLGHELGHYVNGDLRRGLVTQSAFSTLATLADLLRPTRSVAGSRGLTALLVSAATNALLAVVHRLLLVGQILLLWVGLRDIQRAEYFADELAAVAAGSAAAADLADTLLTIDGIAIAVRSSARVAGALRSKDGSPVPALATRWREAADAARASAGANLLARRQLSARQEASLFASHPPNGLRGDLIRARPAHLAQVTLPAADSARIDTELARHYERIRRELAVLD